MYAKGVEAFVYNRTPAYDAIVERMKKHENEAGGVKGASHGYGDFEEELGLRARLKTWRECRQRTALPRELHQITNILALVS